MHTTHSSTRVSSAAPTAGAVIGWSGEWSTRAVTSTATLSSPAHSSGRTATRDGPRPTRPVIAEGNAANDPGTSSTVARRSRNGCGVRPADRYSPTQRSSSAARTRAGKAPFAVRIGSSPDTVPVNSTSSQVSIDQAKQSRTSRPRATRRAVPLPERTASAASAADPRCWAIDSGQKVWAPAGAATRASGWSTVAGRPPSAWRARSHAPRGRRGSIGWRRRSSVRTSVALGSHRASPTAALRRRRRASTSPRLSDPNPSWLNGRVRPIAQGWVSSSRPAAARQFSASGAARPDSSSTASVSTLSIAC